MADPVYKAVVKLAQGIILALDQKMIVTGAEHIPDTGGAVIASNHVGYLDFVYVGYGAWKHKRLVRFLAKKEIWGKPVAGWLMSKMRHIPVDRQGDPAASYKAAVAALGEGELIGMFPESTISPSFVPKDAKNGAARMAIETHTPLVPVAVWGSQRILTKWRPKNFQRHVAISVNFGEPMHPAPDADPDDVTAELMERIGALLAEAQRAYPQEPAGPDDTWWLPAHLGGSAPTVEEAAARMAEEAEQKRLRREQRERPGGDSA